MLTTSVLAAIDLTLLSAAVLGYLRGGLWMRPSPASLEDAFAQLEESIWSAFPATPEGYTFREALASVRKAGFTADWDEIDASLLAYEGRKFGGLAARAGFEEVGRLTSRLRRHGYLRRD